ncbi:methyltransferase, FxLD system [Nonomuraea sp. NPDC050540]|uniref:methyltransferase, FxLD system n=1 Tax=Nonomuraea sp. NPDC050540 TaxID=3364367 RepID=UPI00379AEFC5
MTTDAVSLQSPDHLRAAMVAALVERGSIQSPQVEAAFTKVPRHRFAPEAPLADAYSARDTVITKRDSSGVSTSSISAPWLQAEMLQAAQLFRGAKVAEIGSGGYNAALIAEIVGPEGLVVTFDIDPWVTERATRFLTDTGYPQVKVVLGDAEHTVEQHTPKGGFDAVIVTVGVYDIPWGHLLAPTGRMVVPLRFSTVSRSLTFIRDGDHFVGLDPAVCGFVACQGQGALPDQVVALAGGAVKLTLESGPPLDVTALENALRGEPSELWTGVTFDWAEPFDSLNLWGATADDAFGMIWRDEAREEGHLIKPVMRWYCPVLITPGSFAYLSYRELSPDNSARRRWEFGVYGHGRDGAHLAQRLRDHVVTWDQRWRDHPGPAFTLHPTAAEVPPPAVGRIFRKRHTQLILNWE